MEASLLPSKAMRALSKQVIVAAVKSGAPGCAELRKEFGVPFLNSWVVVLDGSGETLASWIGDAAGAGCQKRSADQFPRNLVRGIRKSLERTETVEELERRWRHRQRDRELFDSLARRLGEMRQYGRLRQLCEAAAANPALPKDLRDEFRIQAFMAQSSETARELSESRARSRFVREGEKLLVELAAHPQSADLVSVLFYGGCAHAFDVPAHSARAIARLKRAARDVANAGPLLERVRGFSEIRAKWMEETRGFLQKMDDASSKDFIAATLGDARAAIRLMSRPPYSKHPEYQGWLREARKKVERERLRAGTR